jgi:hypothetical protein
LALKLAGNLIGPLALIVANLAGLGALALAQSPPDQAGPVEVIDLEGERR